MKNRKSIVCLGIVLVLLMTACGTPSPSYTVTTRNEQGNILTQETYTGDTLTMRLTMTYITVPAFQ